MISSTTAKQYSWLIVAAIIKAISVYFPGISFFNQIIAFFFTAKAFIDLKKFHHSKPFYDEIIILSILSFIIMAAYNFGFAFVVSIPYVSLIRFLLVVLMIAVYSAFGILLVSILLCMLIYLCRFQAILEWSFKVSLGILKQNSMEVIFGLLPLGILLFAPIYLQQQMYSFLNLPILGSLLYFVLDVIFFLASFYLAQNTSQKFILPCQENQITEEKVQHVLKVETETGGRNFLPNFAYAISFFLLLLSPLITLVLLYSGVNLWIWLIALALNIYFNLIKKTQSTLMILIAFIPLLITIINFFTL